MDNITVVNGKGMIAKGYGKELTLAGGRMFARRDPWHHKAVVNPEGYYAPDGLALIDPLNEMQLRLVPSGFIHKGRMIPDGFSNVVAAYNTDKPFVYGKVKSGIMTPTEWKEYNPDRPDMPTRSKLYEVLSPDQMVEILDKVVRDEHGNRVKAETMGFLGEQGRDGLFITYRLQDWDKTVVDELQTKVREHLVAFISWDGMMYFYNTETVVVCWNTLMASLRAAKRILKVDHQLGAYDRVVKASTGIYEAAINARALMQDAALWLLNQPVTEDQVMAVAEAVHRDPGEPDEQLVGVRSWEARQKDYENRLTRTKLVRESIVKLWKGEEFHEIIGLTPNMKGTALGAWQAFTFLGSYSPSANNDSFMKQLVSGYRRDAITSSFSNLMTITNAPADKFEVVADEPEFVTA